MRQIILAMIFLCLPGRADAGNGNIVPCMSLDFLQASVQEKSETIYLYRHMNIFKALEGIKELSETAAVAAPVPRDKPCETPGLIRYKNKCYTPDNLKRVKLP